MKMYRAVIYCRCSTEEESQQDALKKQTEEARNTVKEKGWMLIGEYIEAKSGTSTEKRKKYQQLYEDLQNDRFDIVVIKSQDRLMRNTKDWYLFLDRLVTNGKRLFMYLENKFYSADDSLITGIKAILAEEYSRELSKKINNAHKNRQKLGKTFVIPSQTYGLKKIAKGKYILDENEAEVIRLIFHLAKNHGSIVIAHILEERGYRDRRGRVFSEQAIRKIIRNPIRCGTIVQNKRHYDFDLKKEVYLPKEQWEIHQNAVPACVSEEEWEEANHAMDLRAQKRNVDTYYPKGNHVGKYDLSGKLRCGVCGSPYYRTYRKKYKTKEYVIEWKCSEYLYHGKEKCKNICIEENKMFAMLKQICEQYYKGYQLDSKSIVERTISLLEKVLQHTDKEEQQRGLEKQLKNVIQLQEKLLNKLLNDVITDEIYKKKKVELDDKKASIEKELQSISQLEQAKLSFEQRMQSIKYKLETETIEKATVSEMIDNIDTIYVHRKYLEIRFYMDKMLGIDPKSFQTMYEITEDFEGAFVIRFPLPEDFVYRDRKQLERERIIEYMREKPNITAKEIAEKENISLSTANYRIKKLRQDGRIHFNGAGGKGKWCINENR